MPVFDEKTLSIFLEEQSKLFPEGDVVSDLEEARDFLTDNFAVVLDSPREVIEYFGEEGVDLEGMDEKEILNSAEVFDLRDGRYLIVEA